LQKLVYALTFISASARKPITLGVATDLVPATSSSGTSSWRGH
jgi:hypothetical protein